MPAHTAWVPDNTDPRYPAHFLAEKMWDSFKPNPAFARLKMERRMRARGGGGGGRALAADGAAAAAMRAGEAGALEAFRRRAHRRAVERARPFSAQATVTVVVCAAGGDAGGTLEVPFSAHAFRPGAAARAEEDERDAAAAVVQRRRQRQRPSSAPPGRWRGGGAVTGASPAANAAAAASAAGHGNAGKAGLLAAVRSFRSLSSSSSSSSSSSPALARAQRAAAAAQAQCANCADQDRLSQQHIDAALAPMHAAADAVARGAAAARGGKRRAAAAAAAAAAAGSSGEAAAALSVDSGRVLLRAVPLQSGYWQARREGRSAQYVAARINASAREAADPAAPEVGEPPAKPPKQKAPLTAFWKRFESYGYGHAPAWDCSDRLSAGAAKRQSSNWKKAGLWT